MSTDGADRSGLEAAVVRPAIERATLENGELGILTTTPRTSTMNESHPAFDFYIRGQFFGGVEDIPEDAPRRLLPLERFGPAHLKGHTRQVTEEDADRLVQGRIDNSCAGLAPVYRCTGAELREALRRGRLNRKEDICFRWTMSGMRSWELHELYTQWRLSMYELARVVTYTYKRCHPLSRWLNLWGEEPGRALPECDGLTRQERARRRGYEIDSRISGRTGPVRIETTKKQP